MQNKLTKQELIDIIQWDVKTWGKALPFWEEKASLNSGMTALAVGERGGGLSLWLAKKGIKVTCTDYNDFPDSTEKLHQDYKVSDLISYKSNTDVTDLKQFSDETFDIVVFKSVIGALAEKEKQRQALKEIYRVLKPGGQLIFAENLKGSKLHVKLRKRFVRWNTYWRYLNLKTDMDLFDDFAQKEFKTSGFYATFGRTEKQRNFLAFFDRLIMWKIPKLWRYVLFGVLIK